MKIVIINSQIIYQPHFLFPITTVIYPIPVLLESTFHTHIVNICTQLAKSTLQLPFIYLTVLPSHPLHQEQSHSVTYRQSHSQRTYSHTSPMHYLAQHNSVTTTYPFYTLATTSQFSLPPTKSCSVTPALANFGPFQFLLHFLFPLQTSRQHLTHTLSSQQMPRYVYFTSALSSRR